ncbi:MAG TPA: hypothetical protein DCR93_33340 [Cytophagales bacterium]|nr:hypothetical protein [Cytophagales bacterium]
MHGTEDRNVKYEIAEDAITFWIDRNQTACSPQVSTLPDRVPDIVLSVENYLHGNGQDETVVEYFKVISGEHDWFGEPGTDKDVDATIEAWRFFLTIRSQRPNLVTDSF